MSAELLAEMRAYVRRTGCSGARLSKLATGDNKLFAQLEQGREASSRICERAREWMDANPDLPGRNRRSGHRDASDPPVPSCPIMDRDPCGWCGVRGDIGCGCLEQRMRRVA